MDKGGFEPALGTERPSAEMQGSRAAKYGCEILATLEPFHLFVSQRIALPPFKGISPWACQPSSVTESALRLSLHGGEAMRDLAQHPMW